MCPAGWLIWRVAACVMATEWLMTSWSLVLVISLNGPRELCSALVSSGHKHARWASLFRARIAYCIKACAQRLPTVQIYTAAFLMCERRTSAQPSNIDAACARWAVLQRRTSRAAKVSHGCEHHEVSSIHDCIYCLQLPVCSPAHAPPTTPQLYNAGSYFPMAPQACCTRALYGSMRAAAYHGVCCWPACICTVHSQLHLPLLYRARTTRLALLSTTAA